MIALSLAAVSISMVPAAEAGHDDDNPLTEDTCVIGYYACACADLATWNQCSDARTHERCVAAAGVHYDERQGYVCE